MYLGDIFTGQRQPRRAAGHQRPVRLHSRAGLPIGWQLIGPHVRRSDDPARRGRLRARHGLEAGAASVIGSRLGVVHRRTAARGPDVRPWPRHRGHRTRTAHLHRSMRELGARGLPRRATGSRMNGSRPTACRASRFRSTSRILAWRSSSSRRCWKSKARDPEIVPADSPARSGPRDRQRVSTATAPDAAQPVRHARRRPTRSTTRQSRTARASSSTSITGTRRAIPTRTSPKRSRYGSIPNRTGPIALRRMAGAAKARIHGSADARAGAAQAGR